LLGGRWAHTHDAPARLPAVASGDDAGFRCEGRGLFTAASEGEQKRRRAPSLMPEALPAVTVPSGFHYTLQLGQGLSSVVSARGCSSTETRRGSPFFLRDGHIEDFFRQAASLDRGGGALLAAQSKKRPDRPRGNMKFLGHNFAGLGHGIGAVLGLQCGVHKAPAECGVF